jgi:hypothetical protein
MHFMRRLPTKAEGEAIRDKLGLPKKREITDAERERLAAIRPLTARPFTAPETPRTI